MILDTARLLLFPALMAFAASTDIFSQRIHNSVPAILTMGFFGIAVIDGVPMLDIASHVGAGLVVLGVCTAFFARGWCGGGDVKLAAATALWFGWAHILDYLFQFNTKAARW